MAFYFRQGLDAERTETSTIETTTKPPHDAKEHRSLAPDVRHSHASTKRREIFDTLRTSKQVSSRREPLRSKLFGELGNSSDRTRASHWHERDTMLNPLCDTTQVLINSEGRVSYGTWHGIIAYLTQVHRPSDTYTRAFFLAFRSFATSSDLANALVARARELTTFHGPADSHIRVDRAKQSILHNVFLAIKLWHETYWWALSDDAILPFLCSFLVNEYLPECRGNEAKECYSLLVSVASKNSSINFRSLAGPSATRPTHLIRKLAGEQRKSDSESDESQGRVDSAGSDSRADAGSLAPQERLGIRPTHGSRHTHEPDKQRGFWHRLFGKRDRKRDSGSGSSLFASSDSGSENNQSTYNGLATYIRHNDVPDIARHTNNDSDGATQLESDQSEEPDISDLLMATVGMDLSLEAYRRVTHIYQVSAVDVACQLTIIESSCYCQIEAYELVNKEFSRGSSSHANNVRQMSRWCTQITRWASSTILSEPTPERRCRMLKYFIELGIQLLALKNFDAVMAVKAAVYSAAVMRLKRTWSVLPKKYTIMCRRLHEATDPDHNYANYRNMLRRSQPPLLPFLGLYLTDLTFLDDGNPTYRRFAQPDKLVKSTSRHVHTDSHETTPPVQLTGQTCALFCNRNEVDLNNRAILINFEKAYRIASIIEEMQKFQVEYSGNFTMAIPGLQKYLIEQWEKCEAEGYDDDKIYALSLKCEPRAACTGQDDTLHMRLQPAGVRFSRLLPSAYKRQRSEASSVISDE
ncbi:Ras guanine nucleotide exchange factor bud5 [Coemansia sp. RSA 2526]|nr:Ras guanine nucleotide exchange factor bud5 [Coemansia sp. RSA 2526]